MMDERDRAKAAAESLAEWVAWGLTALPQLAGMDPFKEIQSELRAVNLAIRVMDAKTSRIALAKIAAEMRRRGGGGDPSKN